MRVSSKLLIITRVVPINRSSLQKGLKIHYEGGEKRIATLASSIRLFGEEKGKKRWDILLKKVLS